jgi:hypothetical protein
MRPHPPSPAQSEQFLQALDGIAALPDVRALLPMLIVRYQNPPSSSSIIRPT